MAAAEGLLYALERNWDMVDAALADLDQANLARIPADQCNSVAWILWHMDRVVDTFIHTRLKGCRQNNLVQMTSARIWQIARKDAAFLAYRVATPRHCLKSRNEFSTKCRSLYSARS